MFFLHLRQQRQGILTCIAFVAIDDAALARPAREQIGKLNRFGDIGNAEDAALLCRLDDIGPHLVQIGDLALHMLCHDGLQQARAHLDRLLHEIIEPSDLQRREEVMQIGGSRLRPRFLDRRQQNALAGGEGEAGSPFAVAAVEDEQFGAIFHAQHIGKIVELVLIGLDGDACLDVRCHEQPLHAEIGAHGLPLEFPRNMRWNDSKPGENRTALNEERDHNPIYGGGKQGRDRHGDRPGADDGHEMGAAHQATAMDLVGIALIRGFRLVPGNARSLGFLAHIGEAPPRARGGPFAEETDPEDRADGDMGRTDRKAEPGRNDDGECG